ncbi:uncharacterized protein LOC108824538 [Raphanus sativus]|uniref:Uncharacterized protein LOC108824538 n=1 Tax=Raphanus sativus TaxID=3726 RepID=A0A6J0KZZ0_RAPSA|nr:uncharacterized protein LOC108824538 [Raphanus sativus]
MAASLNKIEIQSGASASFWYDDWSSLGRLIDIVGNGGCMAMGIHKYDTVERAIQVHRRRRHRTDVLNKIEEEIHKLRTKGLTSAEDINLWKCRENTYLPKFSTSQTWRITRTVHTTVAWYKSLWFAKATPKYSFLTWLAVHDRLATGERMKRWNTSTYATCPLCQEPNESRSHLFSSVLTLRPSGED